MAFTSYNIDQIKSFDRNYRMHLINSLSGYKSVNLIGTSDGKVNNLAIFSSMVHLGADPALQGCIIRPDTVERHTLENIRLNGFFTVNQVHDAIKDQAHQCSAKYPKDVSEFDATDLTPWNSVSFPAPYVLESKLKFGLKCLEIKPIEFNGTYFVIGEIQEIWSDEEVLEADGHIDHIKARSVTVTSLDTYSCPNSSIRKKYATP